jgi:hypothetical protein
MTSFIWNSVEKCASYDEITAKPYEELNNNLVFG